MTDETPRSPLTVREVIAEFEAWIARDPKYADYPVMVLDMEGDSTGDDRPCDGLVTEMSVDCFTEEQGYLFLLQSDPFPKSGGTDMLTRGARVRDDWIPPPAGAIR